MLLLLVQLVRFRRRYVHVQDIRECLSVEAVRNGDCTPPGGVATLQGLKTRCERLVWSLSEVPRSLPRQYRRSAIISVMV